MRVSPHPAPDLTREQALWQAGYGAVAGLDEAGRGAWAGPVVAAAVILPAQVAIADQLAGVADSKLLSPAARAHSYEVILNHARAWGVGVVSAPEIDAQGIAPATRSAMLQALAALAVPADALLLDYVRLPESPLPQQALAHGDRLVLSIAAASILAKVTRDRLMADLHAEYPCYGFAQHKGYGTAQHRQTLQVCGPCSLHRRSFAPVHALQLHLFAG
ncbi:MAG: ribonuclease HII [Caldilineales bacterium]